MPTGHVGLNELLDLMNSPTVVSILRVTVVPEVRLHEEVELSWQVAKMFLLFIEQLSKLSGKLEMGDLPVSTFVVLLEQRVYPLATGQRLRHDLRLQPVVVLIHRFTRAHAEGLDHRLGCDRPTIFSLVERHCSPPTA